MKILNFMAGFCLVLTAACSSSQEKAENQTATAMALVNAGDFAAARVAILSAIAERDDLPIQWLLLGHIDLELGHAGDALYAFSRVLELEATNGEALQLVAELSFQLGYSRDAVNAADRMLALDPNSTRAMLVKGLVALDQKHLPEAREYADSILKINARDEFGIVLKARVIAAEGNHEEAAKLIEDSVPEALRTDPSLATLIELHRVIGDTGRTVAAVEALIAKRPKDADLKLDLAQILYKSGNMPRARSTLSELLVAQPDDAGVIRKISELWMEKDPAALSPDQLAKIEQSGTQAMRVGVARYLIARGHSGRAAAILRPVAVGRADVGAIEAKALYATALLATGNVKAARDMADLIIEDDKNNADALLLRARIALQRRDLTAALNDAQIVVRDYPQNEQARILLADIFLGRTETQRARQNYEAAMSDMPQSIVLAGAYTRFLLQSGDKARAVGVGQTFTLKNPSSIEGWGLLANVCNQVGDRECVARAEAGRVKAAASYTIDQRPGSVRSRGLFGRL